MQKSVTIDKVIETTQKHKNTDNPWISFKKTDQNCLAEGKSHHAISPILVLTFALLFVRDFR